MIRSQSETRLHINRAFSGNRNHRDLGSNPFSSFRAGQGVGKEIGMPVEHAPNRHRFDDVHGRRGRYDFLLCSQC